MIEDSEVLALNSHETVLQISTANGSLNEAVQWLKQELDLRKILFPTTFALRKNERRYRTLCYWP